MMFRNAGMLVHVNKILFAGATFNQRCVVLKQRAPWVQKGKKRNKNWKEKISGRESG